MPNCHSTSRDIGRGRPTVHQTTNEARRACSEHGLVMGTGEFYWWVVAANELLVDPQHASNSRCAAEVYCTPPGLVGDLAYVLFKDQYLIGIDCYSGALQ